MARRREYGLSLPLAASLAFHGAFFAAWFYFLMGPGSGKTVVISNVDLILQEKQQEKNKTLSFLKMALPQLPKAPEVPQPLKPLEQELPKAPPKLAPLDIKAPERQRRAMDLPQSLAERTGRLQQQEKLELDAGRKISAGPLDAGLDMKAERGGSALPARIELEEVGMRKAPPVPKGLQFDERAPAVRPQTMQELNTAMETNRRAVAGPQALAERQGEVAAARRAPAITAAPQRLAEAQSAEVQVSARPQPVMSAEALSLNRRADALRQARAEEAPKLEITGPLSRRRVLRSYAPAFPDWARDRGILEAAVSVKFYVDNSGAVLDNAAVDKTSGYGALDRLAVDAIKRWAFESLGGAPSTQWGIITFRFIAE
jgi:TonB family protein